MGIDQYIILTVHDEQRTGHFFDFLTVVEQGIFLRRGVVDPQSPPFYQRNGIGIGHNDILMAPDNGYFKCLGAFFDKVFK